MGSKIYFTGLFILIALNSLVPGAGQVGLVGAIVMLIGLILMYLDR